jgi:hypothetical protein
MVEALSFFMALIVENKLSRVKCVLLSYILLGIIHYKLQCFSGFWSDTDIHDPVVVTL